MGRSNCCLRTRWCVLWGLSICVTYFFLLILGRSKHGDLLCIYLSVGSEISCSIIRSALASYSQNIMKLSAIIAVVAASVALASPAAVCYLNPSKKIPV